LLSDPRNGAIKLFLIWRAIRTRNRRKKLFAEGSYHPVSVEGIHKEHILAFRRSEGESSAITIAPRFMTSIIAEGEYPLGEAVWKDTAILVDADCEWLEGITGETITSSHKRILITDILKQFPAGLLLKGEGI
jgi:(1->4)-alpha-D-glucan 1-alpha-D-glucosylmutase